RSGVWRMVVLVFFSSRRRHTRFSRDWSSDVCSSDLDKVLRPETGQNLVPIDIGGPWIELIFLDQDVGYVIHGKVLALEFVPKPRSEERRVGKEGRSRCSPANYSRERVIARTIARVTK